MVGVRKANEGDRALSESEAEYSKRLFDAVLETVINLNAVPGTEGGYVSPDIVRIALIDVMVAVDFNCGLGRVPSERRKTGEYIGSRYTKLLKDFIDNPECAWGRWGSRSAPAPMHCPE